MLQKDGNVKDENMQFQRGVRQPNHSHHPAVPGPPVISLLRMTVRGLLVACTVLLTTAERVWAQPSISATKQDALAVDADGDGVADPGDTIHYNITIGNSGTSDATGVSLSDTPDANLSFGAMTITPLAFNDGPYSTVGNVPLTVDAASGVLANDSDIDGNTPLTVSASDTTSANGGSVAVSADGSFTYNPPAGFSGSDTFTYLVQDNTGLNSNESGVVTITVGTPVWFINSSAAGGGDGRFGSPFNSISAFNSTAADDPGDIIFVYEGASQTTPYSTGITLLNNQQLIGEGSGLTIAPNVSIAAGNDPVLSNGAGSAVTLASGNTITGLTVGNTAASGAAFKDGGASIGTLALTNVTVIGTGGIINLANGGTLNNVTFDSIASTGSSGVAAIRLSGVGGSLTVTNGAGTDTSIAGAAAGIDIQIAGALASFNFGDVSISSTGTGVNLPASNADTATFTFASLAVTTTVGAGLVANGTGTVNLSGSASTINATGGAGLDITSTAFGATFASVSSTNSPTTGINLVNVAGSGLTINGGSITGAVGTAFNVDGGTPNISYAGSIANAAGRAVSVQNRTGGTVTFSGAVTDSGGSNSGILISNNSVGSPVIQFSGTGATGVDVSDTSGTAVTVSNNLGATISFADLDITNTTTNQTGLFATNGGTLNVMQGNINAGQVRSVDIDNMALGVSLTSVSSSGGTAPGIDLATTTGSFAVVGDGANTAAGGNGSGGTIANKTGVDDAGAGGLSNGIGLGILLNNAQNVTLRRMLLRDFTNYGIHGTSVTNLTIANTTVTTSAFGANGTSATQDEASTRFNNLLGAASFTDNIISGGLEDNISVLNTSGTLNRLTVSGGTIGLNDTALGNDGILIESQGSAVCNITVEGVTFIGARGDLFQSNTLGTSSMDVVLRDNTFANAHSNIVSGGGGVTISGGSVTSNINLTYLVEGTTPGDQTFRDALGNALTVNIVNGIGSISGTIRNNHIGVAGANKSGSRQGAGISVGASQVAGGAFAPGSLTHSVTIENNVIRETVGFAGLDMLANTDARLNCTVTNNTITDMNAVSGVDFPLAAVYLIVGGSAASGDFSVMCANLQNNTFDGSGIPAGSFPIAGMHFDQISSDAHYNLPQYAGGANGASGDINTYLAGRGNTITPPGGTASVEAGSTVGVTGTGTSCP